MTAVAALPHASVHSTSGRICYAGRRSVCGASRNDPRSAGEHTARTDGRVSDLEGSLSSERRHSVAPCAVRSVSAAETWPLRHRVLRPHQRGPEIVLPGDDHPAALHLAAVVDGEIAAVGSVMPEKPERPVDSSDSGNAAAMLHLPGDWRVRGMAVRPESRRTGLGRAILDGMIDHAIARGGTALWCHARVSAEPFYTALRFRAEGAPFDVPEIGPHLLMWLPL